jgi:hypothetical protein
MFQFSLIYISSLENCCWRRYTKRSRLFKDRMALTRKAVSFVKTLEVPVGSKEVNVREKREKRQAF